LREGQDVLLTAYATSTTELVRTLVTHRRLLVALAKRELSDEYVGHSLSVSWAVIHPLFLMVVYVFVFIAIFPSRISAPLGLETNSIIYLLSGLIPWLAISQVMSRSLTSVTGNGSIVKQMAFPLELLPVKTLAGPLLFSGISLFFLIGYSLWITKGAILPAYLFGLPLLIVLTLMLLVGLALVLSCLQVFLRDIKEFINLFLTIGLFIHPILYFPGAVPAAVRPILYFSPFSYALFCWHDIMFYGEIVRIWAWLAYVAIAVLLFVIGARLFIVSKNNFGDFL
jgi:lipopolysaccharide transport system permease protein